MARKPLGGNAQPTQVPMVAPPAPVERDDIPAAQPPRLMVGRPVLTADGDLALVVPEQPSPVPFVAPPMPIESDQPVEAHEVPVVDHVANVRETMTELDQAATLLAGQADAFVAQMLVRLVETLGEMVNVLGRMDEALRIVGQQQQYTTNMVIQAKADFETAMSSNPLGKILGRMMPQQRG